MPCITLDSLKRKGTAFWFTSFPLPSQEVGVDKDSHLNLRQVPADLLPALEGHLSEMDSTKKLSGSATRLVS